MPLYDTDFYEWAREQATSLRSRLSERAITDLDLENLANEIESLGKRDRRTVRRKIVRIIEHLLMLEFSRSKLLSRLWERTALNDRFRLYQILRDSPSLRRQIDLEDAYLRGRKRAAWRLRKRPDTESLLPSACPYSLDQIEDEDFWPGRKHA